MEKKRMGRPPKAPEDRAGPQVQFRLRGEVKAEIERQALLMGRSISEECEHRLTKSVIAPAAVAEIFGGSVYAPLLLAIANVVRLTSAPASKPKDIEQVPKVSDVEVYAAIIYFIEQLSGEEAAVLLEEASRIGDDWIDYASRVMLLEKGLLRSLSDIVGR